MIYKLYSTDIYDPTKIDAATTVGVNPQVSFLFAPENPDYQTFKAQINADEAQLQDADGNTMTAEQAKAYVVTLP
jgi:hypothetical protein